MDDPAVKKVRDFLETVGYDGKIRHTEDTIFTVEDASRAVGAPEEEILKSLIFLVSGEPVLVLMSGVNKGDGKKIALCAGVSKSRIKMASPDFVFCNFGYKVGGVPPVGYDPPIRAFLDEDLLKYETVWAAAGTDHDFFPIGPEKLREYTKGEFLDLKIE